MANPSGSRLNGATACARQPLISAILGVIAAQAQADDPVTTDGDSDYWIVRLRLRGQ